VSFLSLICYGSARLDVTHISLKCCVKHDLVPDDFSAHDIFQLLLWKWIVINICHSRTRADKMTFREFEKSRTLCLLILTFFGIALAPLPWLIGVLHACFYYRKEQMHNVIETLTTKMAEKLKQREAPPLLTPGSRSIPPGTPKG
jgi:hypothetical protein